GTAGVDGPAAIAFLDGAQDTTCGPGGRGGGTDIENAALLCGRHHTMVHQLGWTLTRDPETGRFDVQPPSSEDGRALPASP
ncbi:MAG: hypothetical protein ACREQM_19790, partial [Candidatus Dormibacteraceae bacterium]